MVHTCFVLRGVAKQEGKEGIALEKVMRKGTLPVNIWFAVVNTSHQLFAKGDAMPRELKQRAVKGHIHSMRVYLALGAEHSSS